MTWFSECTIVLFYVTTENQTTEILPTSILYTSGTWSEGRGFLSKNVKVTTLERGENLFIH